MVRIGIFGGTFDPPHLGHLILAETCADALGLARVLWVPAATPPHKQNVSITAAAHRVAMVKAAIADNPRFALSRVDLDRPGPHYSADMVGLVATEHPNATLVFLMGSDSLRDLLSWHDPARLVAQCRLGVMRRQGKRVEAVLESLYNALPALPDKLEIVDAPYIEISGTEVRRRIYKGLSIRYRVTDGVAAYIKREELYKRDDDQRRANIVTR